MQSRRFDHTGISQPSRGPVPNDAQSAASQAASAPTLPRWVDAKRRAHPQGNNANDVLLPRTEASAEPQAQSPGIHEMLDSPEPCEMRRLDAPSIPRLPPDMSPGKLLAVALLRPAGDDAVKTVGLATDPSKFAAWDPRRLVFEKGVKSTCEIVAGSAPQGRRLATLRDYQAFSEFSEGVIAVALTQGYYPERAGYVAAHEALKAYIGRQPSDGNAAAAAVLVSCANPGAADQLSGLQIKVHETTKIFLDVIDQTISRGENLEGLKEQAEELGLSARQFEKTAKAVKRSFQCCKIM